MDRARCSIRIRGSQHETGARCNPGMGKRKRYAYFDKTVVEEKPDRGRPGDRSILILLAGHGGHQLLDLRARPRVVVIRHLSVPSGCVGARPGRALWGEDDGENGEGTEEVRSERRWWRRRRGKHGFVGLSELSFFSLGGSLGQKYGTVLWGVSLCFCVCVNGDQVRRVVVRGSRLPCRIKERIQGPVNKPMIRKEEEEKKEKRIDFLANWISRSRISLEDNLKSALQ